MLKLILAALVSAATAILLSIAEQNGVISNLPDWVPYALGLVVFLGSSCLINIERKEKLSIDARLDSMWQKLNAPPPTSQHITGTSHVLNPWLQAQDLAKELYSFIRDRRGAGLKKKELVSQFNSLYSDRFSEIRHNFHRAGVQDEELNGRETTAERLRDVMNIAELLTRMSIRLPSP